MKFVMHSAVLADTIAAAISSLPARPTDAVMGGVLIETTADDVVSLSSFNYDRATICAAPAEVHASDSALVSGRLLATVGGNLPKKAEATITVGDTTMSIVAGRTEYRLPLLHVHDYPRLPVMDAADSIGSVDCREFADAVRTIGGFAGTDPAVQQTLALNIDCQPGSLTVSATDRYILGRRVLEWTGEATANINVTASDLLATIKAVAATETEPVEILWNEQLLGLRTPTTTVITRVLAEEFPNIERIVTTDLYETAATIPTAELQTMLKRAAAIADDQYAHIDIAVEDDELSVSTTQSGTGNVVDATPVTQHGPNRRLALSSRRLLSTLTAIRAGDVTLAFRNDGHLSKLVTLYPGGIEPDDGVLLPPGTDTVAALIGLSGR